MPTNPNPMHKLQTFLSRTEHIVWPTKTYFCKMSLFTTQFKRYEINWKRFCTFLMPFTNNCRRRKQTEIKSSIRVENILCTKQTNKTNAPNEIYINILISIKTNPDLLQRMVWGFAWEISVHSDLKESLVPAD